jgi:hypothetical protein
MEKGNAMAFFKHSFPLKFPGFKITPATQIEIQILIPSLKSEI